MSRAYGVFNEQRGRSERAIFVIDAAGIVRYIDLHQLREVPDETQVLEQLDQMPRE